MRFGVWRYEMVWYGWMDLYEYVKYEDKSQEYGYSVDYKNAIESEKNRSLTSTY
jgi:hypothetical protein